MIHSGIICYLVVFNPFDNIKVKIRIFPKTGVNNLKNT